ncbi:MAG: hypothetical protein ABW072_18660, partial [Sedimenticola sp.]
RINSGILTEEEDDLIILGVEPSEAGRSPIQTNYSECGLRQWDSNVLSTGLNQSQPEDETDPPRLDSSDSECSDYDEAEMETIGDYM